MTIVKHTSDLYALIICARVFDTADRAAACSVVVTILEAMNLGRETNHCAQNKLRVF